jgi:hypothetical protein
VMAKKCLPHPRRIRAPLLAPLCPLSLLLLLPLSLLSRTALHRRLRRQRPL